MRVAIAGPLFEEPFKLIPIFFVLYLFNVRRIKSIFLLAIASGLGFQIVEDFAYIRQDMPEGFSYAVSGILGRIMNGVVSHWVYTALFMVGLFLIVQATKGRKELMLTGWFYFVSLVLAFTLSAIHHLAKSRQNSLSLFHS